MGKNKNYKQLNASIINNYLEKAIKSNFRKEFREKLKTIKLLFAGRNIVPLSALTDNIFPNSLKKTAVFRTFIVKFEKQLKNKGINIALKIQIDKNNEQQVFMIGEPGQKELIMKKNIENRKKLFNANYNKNRSRM